MLRRDRIRILLNCALLVGWAAWPVTADEWPMFRGPNGTGLGSRLTIPNEFKLEDASWKIETGHGGSSVIAVGEKIFLTSYDDQSRFLKCYSTTNGEELWSHSLPKARSETATPPNDPAICTPVTDGKIVCALFPDAGLIVTNIDGEIKWQKDLGPFYSMHGISTSPLIAGGKIVLTIDQLQDPFIVALNAESGEEVWRQDRFIGVTGGYSTPVYMKLNDIELVISAGPGELVGYDLATGETKLTCNGIANAPVGIPVVRDNRIFYCEPVGEPLPMAALGNADQNNDGVIELEEVKGSLPAYRLIERIDNGFGNRDGKVDQAEWDKGFGTFLNSGGLFCLEIVETNGKLESTVIWKYTKSVPYIPSLLVADNSVYMINDGGILTTFDRDTGEVSNRRRVKNASGKYYASPVSDGQRLVLATLEGKLSLLQVGDDGDPLTILDFEEQVVATPAIHNGRLYVRTASSLYCFSGNHL